MTCAYVLPIMAINMFRSKMGTNTMKMANTDLLRFGYVVEPRSEYWKKKSPYHHDPSNTVQSLKDADSSNPEQVGQLFKMDRNSL